YLTSGPGARSEIQIDGVNAYPPAAAESINPTGKGLPTIDYFYTQDRKTGITDTVTITQDHSGHIAWVSHLLQNTGTCHYVDLLWDNNQRFGDGDASQ